jgi:hypothetical protein
MWVIAVFVLAGAGATLYLRARLPREERAAGIAALSAMEGREFMQLVLSVLHRRGYERTYDQKIPLQPGEYLLERDGQRWLLSTRYSQAYAPGSTAIAEFGSQLRQRGIHGGVLAIPGKFPRGAAGLARGHRVQLIDTAHHWQELEPLLTDAQLEAINAPAEARMRRQTRLAWTAAAVIALVLALIGHDRGRQQAEAPATGDAVPVASQSEEAVVPPPPPSAAAAPPDATLAPLPLEQRRADLAEAIAALPHVLGASWTTESTLRVEVDDDTFDPRTELCPLLEADPDLRASRVQLQAPPGSTRPVRFLQCRAY